jgi:hypothetical protein
MMTVGSKGSEESIGRVLGVQVKAAEADLSHTVILDRRDAVDLLRQAQATCIVGVDLQNGEVRFRFIDQPEIDSLFEFLNTDAKTMSFPFSKMDGDSRSFDKQLHRLTNPTIQPQLHRYRIQKRLAASVSGAQIMVLQDGELTIPHIALPGIGEAFDVDPGVREKVRLRFLNYGDVVPGTPGVSFKPAIQEALDELSSSGALISAGQKSQKLTIECGGEHASATFIVRHFGDEFAYVLRAGLRLSISRARKTTEGWIHFCEFDIFEPSLAISLSGASLAFLRLLRPGARILMSPRNKIPITQWGESLEKIGPAVDAACALSQALKFEFSDFQLVDLTNEEFGNTLGFLDSLLLDSVPLENLTLGFVLGPMADVPPEKIPTRAATFTVPVVMNWKQMGIAIWVTCEGSAFMNGEQVCGLRIERQLDWRVKKLERFKKSNRPELWFFEDWPAIRIGDIEPGVRDWKAQAEFAITLEARIKVDME